MNPNVAAYVAERSARLMAGVVAERAGDVGAGVLRGLGIARPRQRPRPMLVAPPPQLPPEVVQNIQDFAGQPEPPAPGRLRQTARRTWRRVEGVAWGAWQAVPTTQENLEIAGVGLGVAARHAPGLLMGGARLGARVALHNLDMAFAPVDALMQRLAGMTHEEATSSNNWRDLFGTMRDAFRAAPPEDEDHDRAQELFQPLREVTRAITEDLNNDEHIATAERFAAETRALLADGRAQEAEARIGLMRVVLDAMRRM